MPHPDGRCRWGNCFSCIRADKSPHWGMVSIDTFWIIKCLAKVYLVEALLRNLLHYDVEDITLVELWSADTRKLVWHEQNNDPLMSLLTGVHVCQHQTQSRSNEGSSMLTTLTSSAYSQCLAISSIQQSPALTFTWMLSSSIPIKPR